jgi:two-component system sensor histidine kinase DesK
VIAIGADADDFRLRAFRWMARHRWGWIVSIWTPVLMIGPLIATVQDPSPVGIIALVAIPALFAGFVWLAIETSAWTLRVIRPVTLTALVGACAAVVLAEGDGWISAWGFTGVAAAIGFPALGSAITLVSAAVVAGVTTALAASHAIVAASATVLFTGVGAFVIQQLAVSNAELERTRRLLARSAVEEERLRFARDLHDVAGHTLSVIVVKAETARRLAPTDPDAAAEHAADIERLGRDALRELRTAVAGYRRSSLDAELERARTSLASRGVDLAVRKDAGGLDAEIDALFGSVVLEASTNLLRHAQRATVCRVTVVAEPSLASIEVEDDGVAPAPVREGTGLTGLRERVRRLGGDLVVEADGGFRVRAEVPA